MFELFNQYLPIINSVAATIAAIRLITFNRHEQGLHYRFSAAICAYALIICFASIPIRTLLGDYRMHDISETMLNVSLCVVILAAKGNVAKAFNIGGGGVDVRKI